MKVYLTAAAIAVTGVSLLAGLRPAPVAPAPAVPVAAAPETPHEDVQLASLQTSFAMSHLGALRDEAELEPKQPTRNVEKPRAAAPRAAGGVRPAAAPPSVIASPLPPTTSPAPAAAPAESEPGPSLFGVSLPSPGKWVDRVASLGDSITSLVRWR